VVDLRPLNIEQTGLRVDGAVDMVEKAKFAESEFKQGTPRGIIGIVEVKDLRNMVFDVQQRDGGGSDGHGHGRCGDVERVDVVAGGTRGVGGGSAIGRGEGQRKKGIQD
jgi:hypothetical protein